MIVWVGHTGADEKLGRARLPVVPNLCSLGFALAAEAQTLLRELGIQKRTSAAKAGLVLFTPHWHE
jgi:hypothetical protein